MIFAIMAAVVAVSDPLTMERSIDLAHGAIFACGSKGFAVSAAVVDAQGVPIVVLRADGSAKAPVAAPKKAATAVAFDAPGSEMEPREKNDPVFAAKIAAHPELYNAHGGSLSIHDAAGKVIGGVAVADVGHEIADQCVRMALANWLNN